jgi:hypothetical protein
MRSIPRILAVALVSMGAPAVLAAAPVEQSAVAIGERLYRQGLRASGVPLTGTVQGDVPVSGSQFSCVNCHLRSGMGSSEAAIVAPPVTAPILFGARETEPKKRPAYDETSLARALRAGVDPAGRVLDPLMPRYALDDAEVGSLAAYLRTLSAAPSPGVGASTLTFATVVADGAPPAQRAAMLGVLNAYFQSKNVQTRAESRRADRSEALKQPMYQAWREWVLRVWELHGPPSSWRDQLDTYYRKEPVFALLSGLTAGDWSPIHEWSETNRVPCLLPLTDRPALRDGDFYTLYFSKGLALEAQAIATRLSTIQAPARIVQVFRVGAAGEVGARELRRALQAAGRSTSVEDVAIAQESPVAAIRGGVGSGPVAALILWLDRADLDAISASDAAAGVSALYLSATLSDLAPEATLPGLGVSQILASPFSLPDEARLRGKRLEIWLAQRGLPKDEIRVRDETFFACMIAGEGLMHVRQYLYRDYFLELIDHTAGAAAYAGTYPRLSFGPGQRYLAKGCYLIRLGEGRTGAAKDAWVVP